MGGFWAVVSATSRLYQLWAVCYVFLALYLEHETLLLVAERPRLSIDTSFLWPRPFASVLRRPMLSVRLGLTSASGMLWVASYGLHRLSSKLADDGTGGMRLWTSNAVAGPLLLCTRLLASLHGCTIRLQNTAESSLHEKTHDLWGLSVAITHTFHTWMMQTLCCLFAGVVLLMLLGVGDTRSSVVALEICCLIASCVFVSTSCVSEAVFPVMLWFWGNHQRENCPAQRSVAVTVKNCCAAFVGKISIALACVGAMLAAHVAELVLLWLLSVILAMWVPAALLSRQCSMISLWTGIASWIMGQSGSSCAAVHIWIVPCLATHLLSRVLQASAINFGHKTTAHASSLLCALCMLLALFFPCILSWLAAGFSTTANAAFLGVCVGAEAVCARLRGRAALLSDGVACLRMLFNAVVLAFPFGVVEGVHALVLPTPLIPRMALALAFLGLIIENEAALRHQLARALVPQPAEHPS
eukprot:CAMPEP_0174874738 /NCGR_PEP_ID=MMETSP1114-20130205/77258_1 /TAXON_ID=312471 /ORGANISM="Neobodo designis, Strain CCAP 1951/1" /LENGTH=470 /DNA_ID=CAMNT_0016110079 /DNA_START=30 /DNA_END=1438 /DNA_ORIENTATION=+